MKFSIKPSYMLFSVHGDAKPNFIFRTIICDNNKSEYLHSLLEEHSEYDFVAIDLRGLNPDEFHIMSFPERPASHFDKDIVADAFVSFLKIGKHKSVKYFGPL